MCLGHAAREWHADAGISLHGNFSFCRDTSRIKYSQVCTCPALCREGTYTGSSGCVACTAGKYTDVPGLRQCKWCPTGRFTFRLIGLHRGAPTGAAKCIDHCPAGWIKSSGASWTSTCKQAGTVQVFNYSQVEKLAGFNGI